MNRSLLFSVFILLCFVAPLKSQTCFDPGTGVDGTYLASSNTTLTGGTYNYSSFTINPGVIVTVTGTQPLIIHCTGTVTINGALNANGGNGMNGITFSTYGPGGVGVAGGGNGGDGTYSSSTGPLDGIDGNGSGGVNTKGVNWSGGGGAGYATIGNSSGGTGGFGGPVYGNANISGMEAGSGGGGGSGGYSCGGGGGGAGGGIIAIYAGMGINIGATGSISCNGGNGGSDGTGNCGGGGGGSGGSIIIASPNITHNGSLNCIGGNGGSSAVPGSPWYGDGATGANGRIRIDHNGVLAGTGTSNPTANVNPSITGSPTITAMATPNDSVCTGEQVTLNGGGGVSYTWTGGVNNGIAFTPGATATYTVTGTDGMGCTNTASITVTVSAAPVVGFMTSPNDSVCSGTTLVLQGSGAVSYTWSGGVFDGIGFIPAASGSYTVTGTSAEGCTATAIANIVVLASPNVNLGADIVQPNPPALLDAGAGFTSYLWNTSDTTQTLSANTNGTYIVTVTNAEGCTDTDTIQVNFTAGIINPNGSEISINMYPNPTNGILYLQINNLPDGVLGLDILDLTGKIVFNRMIHSNNSGFNQVLNLENLNSGVYILRINNGDISHQLKFIINK